MKSLLILRHAKSSWKNKYLSDHDRPLNKRGKRDAPRMGQLIRNEDLVPDLILTSSAERALKTAEAAADACGFEDEIQIVRSFYHGSIGTYHDVLSQVSDKISRVLIVGHNPGLEDFLEDLIGVWERLPTAALAHITLPIRSWKNFDEQIEGHLENLWVPRELSP
ncbi:MAG: histidine phosphatase family protein [Anaerolineae bacterium]|nr:MAG: histidine phosphatase family protein [Anaerolineae bacterium]